ncbi:MAG: hypothetical protein ABJB47_12400 [Actinomycetota bacterium]
MAGHFGPAVMHGDVLRHGLVLAAMNVFRIELAAECDSPDGVYAVRAEELLMHINCSSQSLAGLSVPACQAFLGWVEK